MTKKQIVLWIVGCVSFICIIGLLSYWDIQAIITSVLVCVTAYYAYANWRILAEMQKSRRADYLEKQLRCLYSPLKSHIIEENGKYLFDFSTESTPPFGDQTSFYHYKQPWRDWFTDVIEKNIHLAPKNLQSSLLALKHDIGEELSDIIREHQDTFQGILYKYEERSKKLRELT